MSQARESRAGRGGAARHRPGRDGVCRDAPGRDAPRRDHTGGPRTFAVGTPVGEARVHVHEARGAAARPRSIVVLGHGAGGGVDAPDLVRLSGELPARGHRVVLVEQPWRVAGRRVAAPPATLDLAWLAVLDALRDDGASPTDVPLVLGGRSAGARVAARTALVTGAAGVLALAFPLHPPRRPERSRAPEAHGVTGAAVPLLVVQGDRDPFGGPDEIRAAVPDAVVVRVPGAEHGFKVTRQGPGTQGEALDLVAAAVARWLTEVVALPR